MYSTSEDEMSRDSRWNQSAYTDYDVIAGAHLFTSANDAPVNDVTLGFPLTHAGATFAFRDQVGLYNNHVCVCVFSYFNSRFCDITPILRSLHWLKITERIEYKLLLLTY